MLGIFHHLLALNYEVPLRSVHFQALFVESRGEDAVTRQPKHITNGLLPYLLGQGGYLLPGFLPIFPKLILNERMVYTGHG